MEMTYNGTLTMPANFAAFDAEEMTYVAGGEYYGCNGFSSVYAASSHYSSLATICWFAGVTGGISAAALGAKAGGAAGAALGAIGGFLGYELCNKFHDAFADCAHDVLHCGISGAVTVTWERYGYNLYYSFSSPGSSHSSSGGHSHGGGGGNW